MIIDPQGPKDGEYRALRGGSWVNSGRRCRSADRRVNSPTYRYDYCGFRIMATLRTKMLVDPQGPKEGSDRVLLGGSWFYYGSTCRSADRYGSTPTFRNYFCGFRVMATPRTGGKMMMAGSDLCDVVAADPGDELAWLALADQLEEDGQMDRAALLRCSTFLRLAPPNDPDRPATEEHLLALLNTGVEPVSLSMPICGIDMVLIPPGIYLQGSPPDEEHRSAAEGPQRWVALPPFLLSRYPVTQAQWQQVMGSNPSNFKGDDLPVESVSWDDCQPFAKALNEMQDVWNFALPTEARWEYACRAGTATPFAFGKSLSSHQANFNGNYPYGGAPKGPYLQKTSPVGSYRPNAFGLYDMHGNVWEWCQDWYASDAYSRTEEQASEEEVLKVLRGSSWFSNGWSCRPAYRYGNTPTSRHDYYGFRLMADPRVTGEGFKSRRGGSWNSSGRGCQSAFRSGNAPNCRFNIYGFRLMADPRVA